MSKHEEHMADMEELVRLPEEAVDAASPVYP